MKQAFLFSVVLVFYLSLFSVFSQSLSFLFSHYKSFYINIYLLVALVGGLVLFFFTLFLSPLSPPSLFSLAGPRSRRRSSSDAVPALPLCTEHR